MNSSNFSLKDKTILITGASSGIGYCTAQIAADHGANIIAVARNEENLKKLIDSLPTGNHQYIPTDITNAEELASMVSKIDKVDGIVHSAGIVELAPIRFIKADVMDRIRKTNYDAAIFLIQEVLKKKKINKKSSIVLVSSISGLFGMKGNGMYAGTKAALIGIAKVMAHELSSSGIRVNCVAPGMVRTEITENTIKILSKEVVEADEAKYPLGYGDPEDVANPIIFLLSPASKWITGETIVVDGGRTSSI